MFLSYAESNEKRVSVMNPSGLLQKKVTRGEHCSGLRDEVHCCPAIPRPAVWADQGPQEDASLQSWSQIRGHHSTSAFLHETHCPLTVPPTEAWWPATPESRPAPHGSHCTKGCT